jgi:Ca2+-binding RTX toxin-like protein
MAEILVSNIRQVSTTPDGGTPNSWSINPSLSADGTKIAFRSSATNYVPGDTDDFQDLFVKNLDTGAVVRANTASNGSQPNAPPEEFSFLSANGNRLAFETTASNLVPQDTNGVVDVLVKDLTTGRTLRASASADGTGGNDISDSGSLSADGHRVAFWSLATNLVPGDTNNAADVFVKNLDTGAITLASSNGRGIPGNTTSIPGTPALSADGTKVLFTSTASNLVPGDTNGHSDVFVKDLRTGEVTHVSVSDSGGQANGDSYAGALSADGTRVMFSSVADNLVRDDTNGLADLFVKDLRTGEVIRANTAADGAEARSDLFGIPAFSGDGSTVSFTLMNRDLTLDRGGGIYVKDLATGALGFVPNASYFSCLSSDGSRIAFDRPDQNLYMANLHPTPAEELNGGHGRDVIVGGCGPDVIRGGDGADNLDGRAGADVLIGDDDPDLLKGGPGNDTLNGNRGADLLLGESGNDILHGERGRDVLNGGEGRDFLYGGLDYDHLDGGSGNDEMYGDAGNDLLKGGSGNDLLVGGLGRDDLFGGPGDDLFFVQNRDQSPVGRGDVVRDFDPSGGDRVILEVFQDPFVRFLAQEGQAFTGDRSTDYDGEVRWQRVGDGVLIQADANLDRQADAEITLAGVTVLDGSELSYEGWLYI